MAPGRVAGVWRAEGKAQVGPGDATWIPAGSSHSLLNNGDEDMVILVVASPNW